MMGKSRDVQFRGLNSMIKFKQILNSAVKAIGIIGLAAACFVLMAFVGRIAGPVGVLILIVFAILTSYLYVNKYGDD